jgi:ATP-dependent DNA helicase RecQ
LVETAAANRVVYLAEEAGSDLSRGARGYRFVVKSSPIRLSREAEFLDIRRKFARTVLMSATMTVAGKWDFLIDRLGIEDVRRIVLKGQFDYGRQAQLVCFADFPSWAEQADAAMRTVAWQLTGYARQAQAASRFPGAMVLTTSTAVAAGISEHLGMYSAEADLDIPLAAASLYGNRRAVEQFSANGGWLVGTKGLWAGVDIPNPERVRILWVNKLPFPPFNDPLILARRAEVAARAEALGITDPDAYATENYYLAIGAVELRQGVGRLIRSDKHRGVIVISDRKLSGMTSLRRLYRRVFLGSLEPDLLMVSGTLARGDGNVVTMSEGWARIWKFLSASGDVGSDQLEALCQPEALLKQTQLPETLAVRELAISPEADASYRANGTIEAEVCLRAERIASKLNFNKQIALKAEQRNAIAAVARGDDLLALLPTGFGKSYCFQLPALVLPGVTLVVSPLVALMVDQALDLNRTIGGAVRALVGPMRESSSRAGRQEVAEQLTGKSDHGIRIVYCSPERFAQAPFRGWIEDGIRRGVVSRLVFDEAHTLVQWGDDFRPAYRRLAVQLRRLRPLAPGGWLPVSALTATASKSVRDGLMSQVFGSEHGKHGANPRVLKVVGEPIRPELALYRVSMASSGSTRARLLESIFDALSGHTLIYCLTIKDAQRVHAHLRDYAGPEMSPRVRLFHGRLSEAEKSAVLTAFREAPLAGQEDFAPIVVVATAAFGLGINRPDVRCVVVASPPTDLAALHQQLGRAGRDAQSIPHEGDPANVGVALGYAQGLRTVEFLTRDASAETLNMAALSILASDGVIDPGAVANGLISSLVSAGHLSRERAHQEATMDEHRGIVIRALATLADLDAIEDLGDFPRTIRVTRGEVVPADDDDFARAIVRFVDADAGRARQLDLLELMNHQEVRGCAEATDPATMWASLLELHHDGVFDVSQAPNRAILTAVRVLDTRLPTAFAERISSRSRLAAQELAALRFWFEDKGRCANQGLADYFAENPPGAVPLGTCSTPACRCLTCTASKPSSVRLPILEAVLHPPRRVASATEHGRREKRLDDAVQKLLWDMPSGLGISWIRLCLRGSETYYDKADDRRRPLPSSLAYHRLFGAMPGVRDGAISASLTRLVSRGAAIAVGNRWRHSRYVAAEAPAQARRVAGTPRRP